MPKLKRDLNLFELTVYGVGVILGAGIYALIGHAAGIAGNALWLSFLVGAVIASLTGLSYAELSSMFPKEAAEYVYTKKAFGKPLLSFLVGWLMIINGVVIAAAVSLGFGGYLYALTGLSPILGAIILIGACGLLNFYGIKQSAKFNILFTAIETLGLILIILFGLNYYGTVNYFEMPNGIFGVFAGAILIFFAYLGFEDIANVAEETKDPKKTVPKAIVLAVLFTTIIYMLVAMSAVSIVPWNQLASSEAPLADVSNTAVPGSSWWFSIIALFATANTVLISMIVESRMLCGMARGKSLPKFLTKIHCSRGTPWAAILLSTLITMVIVMLFDIRTIAEVTDMNVFTIFIAVNASLIALRLIKPNLKRPFKVPFAIGKFPLLPAIALVSCAAMYVFFDLEPILIGISLLIFGVMMHLIMKKEHIINS